MDAERRVTDKTGPTVNPIVPCIFCRDLSPPFPHRRIASAATHTLEERARGGRKGAWGGGGGANGADGGSYEFMDMLSARAEAEHQHAHGHSREDSGQQHADPYAGGRDASASASAYGHLSAHQSGLQPDPNAHGVVRGTAGAAQGSVGRFVVVEGSPMHRGEEESERNAPSPFPMHDGEIEGEDGQGRLGGRDGEGDGHGDGDEDAVAQEDEDDQAERLRQEQRQAQARQEQRQQHQQLHQHRHPQHHRSDSFPREFYVPRFPSMQVSGASVELRLAISALPLRSVTISPSAQGLEFSPPKLKWTPDSGALDRLFTAVPLATAREGKCKVSYIVGGDDAAEYSEPGPSVLHMYSEGQGKSNSFLRYGEGALHACTDSRAAGLVLTVHPLPVFAVLVVIFSLQTPPFLFRPLLPSTLPAR